MARPSAFTFPPNVNQFWNPISMPCAPQPPDLKVCSPAPASKQSRSSKNSRNFANNEGRALPSEHEDLMKPLLLAVCILFAPRGLSAQTTAWQASPGHTQVPIWPGAVPDAQPVAGPEVAKTTGKEFLVAGKPAVGVSNVSRPTMTVYSPIGKNTGAAVVVFPGGGYLDLAIDLEGTEVCDWLTSKGITCVLLKYRVPGEPGYPKPALYPKSGPYPESPTALEDAQRSVGLVRFHAAEWHIDPHKIGVLGFSSGG